MSAYEASFGGLDLASATVPVGRPEFRFLSAVRRVARQRSPAAALDPGIRAEELRSLAVRRLATETFDVFAKGLNPSRFESWSRGSRSRVARRYGSASDLTLTVLEMAKTSPASPVADAFVEMATEGVPLRHQEVAELAEVMFDCLTRDPGFRLHIMALLAAEQRDDLRAELNESHALLERRLSFGIGLALADSGFHLRGGLTPETVAFIVAGFLDGAALRSMASGLNQGPRVRAAVHEVLAAVTEARPATGSGQRSSKILNQETSTSLSSG